MVGDYRHGTHRAVPPVKTLARVAPYAARCGVTRLADVTGLDTIGIPVFQAVRPLARSLSVSQGKGATRAAAKVSALMEAIELHHAELVAPIAQRAATTDEAAFCGAISRGHTQRAPFDPDRVRGWCDAVDLLSGCKIGVPHALVSMDFTVAAPDDIVPSSNGLASGNDLGEATNSALCELIERDAHSRWLTLSTRERFATAIDIGSIDDRLGRRLIAHVDAAGFGLRLWDLSAGEGPAVILCAIFETFSSKALIQRPALGGGAHPSARIALARAITEAAQSRATMIAGARDDLTDESYQDPANMRLQMLFEGGFGLGGGQSWRMVPDRARASFDTDRDWLIARCAVRGAHGIARVDLSPAEEGIGIVKLIIPGFGDYERPPVP
ncbi:YcaO-like family protein [Sphingomonas sp. MMS24-J13]|uniref:YcaO-like family protein n=1 Tax=Sphingomonas sp. MMS24-J13 TaxID=3238686 RepID=UPI00385077DF